MSSFRRLSVTEQLATMSAKGRWTDIAVTCSEITRCYFLLIEFKFRLARLIMQSSANPCPSRSLA